MGWRDTNRKAYSKMMNKAVSRMYRYLCGYYGLVSESYYAKIQTALDALRALVDEDDTEVQAELDAALRSSGMGKP
jgi:hypothetical protein